MRQPCSSSGLIAGGSLTECAWKAGHTLDTRSENRRARHALTLGSSELACGPVEGTGRDYLWFFSMPLLYVACSCR